MKILLTGGNGQLGSCFKDLVPNSWDILATDSNELDITDFDLVEAMVKSYAPDVIVNAAAYTAVDKAESESELANRINAEGPKNLALAAKKHKARLIHVSTDYVFDGQSRHPYKEDDQTNPLGVYGATKLLGEKNIIDIFPQSIIVRTAWVFSEYGNNFVKTMIRLAKTHERLSIVNDQVGCPTYAGDIAQAIIDVISHNEMSGVYHFCGDKEVSWKEFADVIFSFAEEEKIISKKPLVIGISSRDYPTQAKRPNYSTLACDKIMEKNIAPSDWSAALKKVIIKLKNADC